MDERHESRRRTSGLRDLLQVSLAVAALVWLAAATDVFEGIRHSPSAEDEIVVAFVGVSLGVSYLALRHWRDERRASSARAEAETKYRTLVEHIPAITFIEHPETGEYLYVSPQVETVLGYTSQEWMDDPSLWVERLHPGDRDRVLAVDAAAVEEGWVDEFREIAHDGRVVWLRGEALLVRDDEGRPLFWQGVLVDITQRKEAEARLAEDEVRFRAIVETSREWIWNIDLEGRRTYSNPAVERILGYRPHEMVGRSVFELMHPEDAARASQELPAWVAERRGWSGLVLRWRHRDGSYRVLESDAVPLIDPSGELTGFLGSDRDVTERQHTEEVLRSSEARLRGFIESAPNGVVLCDRDGHITLVNPRIEEEFGYRAEELLGRPIEVLLPEPFRETHTGLREGYVADPLPRHVAGREFTGRRKDGSEFPVEVGLSSYGEGDDLVVSAVVIDISERKAAEEAVRESEGRYRSLFQNMLEGFAYCRMIFEGDRPQDFVYLEVNDRFEELTGLHDVAGKTVTQVIPGIRESHPELFEIYGRVALTGQPERFEIDLDPIGWLSVVVYSPEREHFIAVFDNITERKLAEEEIRRATERLEALHDIDRDILGSTSVEEVVGSALGRIRDFVRAERAAFVWFDRDEGVGVYFGALQERGLGPPVGARVPLEDFPPFALDPEGPSTYLFDLQEWPEQSPLLDRLRALGLRSVVATTIVVDGEVAGDLFVSSTLPNAFSEEDRGVIEEVGSQLAVAVQQVELREELERNAAALEEWARQQAVVARLGLLALEESDLDVVFHEVVRSVAETLDVPLVEVLELLPSEDALFLRAGVGWADGVVGRATVPAGDDSQAGFTLTSGWPMVVENLGSETRFHGPRLLVDHGVVSGVSTIIGTPGSPWGVIGAHTREPWTFTEEDVNFLMAVAGILGTAVDRAQAEDVIVRRARRLQGLHEIDAQVLSASSPVAVAEAVLNAIRHQIPCHHASVWGRLDDDRISFLAVWDQDEALRGPVAGAVLPRKDVIPAGFDAVDVYEPDIRAFEVTSPILGWAMDVGLRSLLVCNFVASGEHLGGLTVTSRETDAFDREQRETIREAADHLAIALRKTWLDEELANRAQDLERLAKERQELLLRIVQAQEDERRRVALEIHDGIGQVLTSISLFASDLAERAPDDLRPRASRVNELVHRAIDDSRQLVRSLRPSELDHMGLAGAVGRLIADANIGEEASISVDLHESIGERRFLPEVEVVVYRVVQESLNNALKHSRASRISVVLAAHDARLQAVVEDDGVGFAPDTVDVGSTTGLGLLGMRERAGLVGGTIVMESSPGKGTTVKLEVPIG